MFQSKIAKYGVFRFGRKVDMKKISTIILGSFISGLYVPCYRLADVYCGQYYVRTPMNLVEYGFPIVLGILLGVMKFERQKYKWGFIAFMILAVAVNVIIVCIHQNMFRLAIYNLIFAAYLFVRTVIMIYDRSYADK